MIKNLASLLTRGGSLDKRKAMCPHGKVRVEDRLGWDVKRWVVICHHGNMCHQRCAPKMKDSTTTCTVLP